MPLHVNSWSRYERAMREAEYPVAIDAGANSGGYTATLLENGFGVIAFEPVPQMFSELAARFKDDARVICNAAGLSDHPHRLNGITVLEAWTLGNPGLGGLSVKPEYKDSAAFDVEFTTIDEYMQGSPVGIIKLDVDGYEYRVLRGAEKTIRRWKPAILCEFSQYIQKVGDSPKEFVEFIGALGYQIESMDGKSIYNGWDAVRPEWPFNTSFDVMLMPVNGEVRQAGPDAK